MLLDDRQKLIIETAMANPALLTRWEQSFVKNIDDLRYRYRARNYFLTKAQDEILEQIGRKVEHVFPRDKRPGIEDHLLEHLKKMFG